MTCRWREKIGVLEFENTDSLLPCSATNLNINGKSLADIFRNESSWDREVSSGKSYPDLWFYTKNGVEDTDGLGGRDGWYMRSIVTVQFNGFAEAGIALENVRFRTVNSDIRFATSIIRIIQVSLFEYLVDVKAQETFAQSSWSSLPRIGIKFSTLGRYDIEVFITQPYPGE